MRLRALTSDNPILVGDFTVLVKPVSRARNLTLRYNPKKSCFVVSGPKRASRKSLVEFVTAHHNWMEQQMRSIPKAPSIIEDGFITIEGIPRKIIHNDASGVHVSLMEDTIMVACRTERLSRALQRFIIQHAEKLISELAYEKSSRISKRITKITLRDTSSRWGSCASDGSLSFSWRLIMAPFDVIDYVVAHEVAHLQHFDHSPAFWALCRELSENYTLGKHWLKLNGAQLQATNLS